MSYALKVKVKALAAESRIIQHEINKRKVKNPRTNFMRAQLAEAQQIEPLKGDPELRSAAKKLREVRRADRAAQRARAWFGKAQEELQALTIHKQVVVRPAARSAHLAYGFLRDRDVLQVEAKNKRSLTENAACYNEVRRLVLRHYEGPLGKDEIIKSLEAWLTVSAGYAVQLPGGSLPAIQQAQKALT